MNFAVGGMSTGNEYPWMPLVTVIRRVHQRRHVNSGQAFENQFLDPKALHGYGSGDPRMQKGSFRRKPTEHGEEILFQLSLNPRQILFGPYLLPVLATLVILLPCHFDLILKVWRDFRGFSGNCRKHAESLDRWHVDCGGRQDGGQKKPESEDVFHFLVCPVSSHYSRNRYIRAKF